MRIRVTLMFDDEAVWYRENETCGRQSSGGMRPSGNVRPKVQFCGRYFESGQARDFHVYDTYQIMDAPYFGYPEFVELDTGPELGSPIGFATNIVGEWDDPRHCMVERYSGCNFTGHVFFSDCDCGCNRMACEVFTPHALGVKDNEFGSVTTSQGVTIAWERVKEESSDEESSSFVAGDVRSVDDGLPVGQRW